MIGILILARLGSIRLFNKHLVYVKNKTFIEFLALRYLTEFATEVEKNECKIIIATSKKEENKKFEEIFKDTEVDVFYGHDDNIPLRQLECADHYNLTGIISIDGDDILCSTHAAREIFNLFNSDTNFPMIKSVGLPFGMNVMGYRVSYLRSCLDTKMNNKLETGWGRIFDENEIFNIQYTDVNNSGKLRFTLDYQLDADFFIKIIEDLEDKIYSISDKALVDYVTQNKIYEINSSLNKEYWENFERQKNKEDKQ